MRHYKKNNTARRSRSQSRQLHVENLEQRQLFAVVATFGAGTLSVFGDNLDNNITVSRNAAGNLLVNGGAVAVSGGTPTVANTALIQVFGQGGNDTITLSETNGALTRANLFGGSGNDTLTGGSGGDQIFGQSGNDITKVNGGGCAEAFTTTANGTRVRFDRLDPAPFSIDIGTTEELFLLANGGNDTFSATGNLAALIKITVDGGTGDDTILGSNGIDLLLGGDGDDFIDGQQGNDVSFLGAGDDVFQWDPGDGSDTVEGEDGTDTMLFNGSAGAEIFAASANGGRVLFTRNLGNIVMDLDDVESIDLNALAGTDTLTVNDLSGTDVVEVNVDLAGTIGGTVGDGEADTVIANATNGEDA